VNLSLENKLEHRIEVTSFGQLLFILSLITGILGMNFGLAFLWIPGFALIFYFIPYFRFYFTNWDISAFRMFSSTTITLGGFLHCRLRIQNPNNFPLRVNFAITHTKSVILVKGWTHQSIQLNPSEKRNFSFIFTFSRRGIHTFFPIQIYRGDPLGLYRDSMKIEDLTEIRVIPARPQIRLSKKQKKDVRDIIAGSHAYKRCGQGDEFFSLREYIRGDEPRKIYWKGSARHGKLISKEFSDEVVFRILVAVDSSWTMRSSKLEYALTSLLELAEMNAQNNDSFGFIIFDQNPRKFLKPQKSPRLYEKTARLTYDHQVTKSHARFESVIPFIFSLKGTRGFLIILSDTEGILEEKLRAITQLAKFGHYMIFCDLRSDKFGVTLADSSLSRDELSTFERVEYLNILKQRVFEKYHTREQKVRETIEQIGGSYLINQPKLITHA
jgi:uncharacterized protein (DUF58 family)